MPKTISKRCVVVIALALGFVPGAFLGPRFGFVAGLITWVVTAIMTFSIIMALDKLEKSGPPQEPEGT